MAANRAVWLEPPSEGGEVEQGLVGMGGCDCAQGGGWHWLARSRAQEEALSLGGEREVGTREKQPVREGSSLCAPPPPGCLPPPFLVVKQNCWPALTISHSLFLPGLSVQDKGADSVRRVPCTEGGVPVLPAKPRGRGRGRAVAWSALRQDSWGGPCDTQDRRQHRLPWVASPASCHQGLLES